MEAQGFMRPPHPLPSSTPPPPPNMTDPQPQLQHHHQQQPPPQGNWFSGQFQYHASQPPPQPPPPQHQQWVPPPSNSYPPLPPPPQPLQQPNNNNNNVYPYHHPLHPQQQPHHHYLPPPPPSHHQHPYSHPPPPAYSQQTWENPNRVYQQSWQHPDGSNVEDWAARAKEWAAAKTVTVDNQHMQHHFVPIGRPEEHSHVYHDQLQQTGDARYADPQQPQHTLSSHQHYPVSSTNFNRPPVNHLQESTFNSGVSSSYVSDGHSAYIARDGAPGGDQNHVYPQGSASGNSSMYQQEVPSSYSSVPAGAEGDGERNEQLRRSSNLQMQEGPHYMQQNFGAAGRSASLDQPHFAYGDLPAEPVATCNRPLEFTPTFSREHDPHPQPSYAHLDPIPSVVSGVVYPPVPSGVQSDPSFGPPGPGHTASMFGQITGSNFHPAISGVSTQYGLGTGISVHPTTPFIGDANGGSTVSDRPKKGSVPNWLREEIIKKKASMVGSYQEHPEGDSTNPIEEEIISNSFINGDQADNKSISSSRLSDDEDDDEDDMKAANTAAHNREIKRVLTEILLKVTDELFDEIATKVIDEEDVTVEADRSINLQKQLSCPPFKTTKASAKVLIPVKGKRSETTDDSEKSSSGAAGDILGLGSYASDEDDEVTVSSIQPTTKPIQPSKLSDISSEDQLHKESEHKRTSSSRAPVRSERDNVATDKDHDKRSNHETSSLQSTLNGSPGIQEDKSNFDGGKMPGAKVGFESKVAIEETDSGESELPHGIVRKTTMEGRSSRSSTDHKNDKEKKRNSGDKISIRKAENAKTNADEKHSNSRRQDQRHVRKEKTEGRDRDVSKERARDRGTKTGEKAKEDSRRDCNSKDETRETEKLKKTSTKEDGNRKRERDKDEKEDKDEREDRSRHSRHRSGRHKRPRSSSISGRGRDSKDNSVGSHADESSDEASEDSRKRKPRSKRRSTSPSPTRSRRRQVSRSPRSKHSHRRHSPHSSLEGSRKRRSRSNSPVHHRRK
ncbi:uncharacterized protein LOC113282368 isoform X1 [Papaver somniferum]|uniref:uncharacterized protein LOC113282368 isoform X1 n=1 Tax=Papaver somniferum TaxID=3469 RepID=UPI000E6F8865|nr:uncharacterized protein LOC113282368 isoform X1 [Papaver somniferum]